MLSALRFPWIGDPFAIEEDEPSEVDTEEETEDENDDV